MVAADRLPIQATADPRSEDLGVVPIASLVVVLEHILLNDGSRRLRVLCQDHVDGWIDDADHLGNQSLAYLSHGATSLGDSFRALPVRYLLGSEFMSDSLWNDDGHDAEYESDSMESFNSAVKAQDGSFVKHGAALLPSAKVEALVAEVEEMAGSREAELEEELACSLPGGLTRRRVGDVLLQRKRNSRSRSSTTSSPLGSRSSGRGNKDLNDLVSAWIGPDANGVSRMEFRKHVRKLIGDERTSIESLREADALFESLDYNANGALDEKELRDALLALQEEAKADAAWRERAVGEAQRWRDRAAAVATAVEKTVAFEAVEQHIDELTNGAAAHTIDARVGSLMLRNNVRLGDVIHSWEKTKGEMDSNQFVRNLGNLDPQGPIGTAEELTALFERIDEDANGKLDVHELKMAFSTMRQQARDRDAEMRSLKRSRASLWNEASTAQAQLIEKGSESFIVGSVEVPTP